MAYGHPKIEVKFNSDQLTHFGGIYLLYLFFKNIGFRVLLSRKIHYSQRNNYYTISEMILALMYPIILGLERITITTLLGNNGVFKTLTGLRSFPQPSTLRRFLIRSSDDLLSQLVSLHQRLRKYFLNLIVRDKKLLFDLDSTVCTVYGNQEGALKGYNPEHRGKKSYHPLFCFEYHSGQSMFGCLRQGNATSATGSYELLVELFNNYSFHEYKMRFRGDAGFYDKKIIALLSQNQVGFAIVADMTEPLKKKVISLDYQETGDDIYSFAETYYQPTDWPKEYRFCIVRRKLPEKETNQTTLFAMDRFSYSAIVTNLTMTPKNVWKFYSNRVKCERNIRSLKNDYYLANIPTKHFGANALYLEILLLAYDLVKWFQRLCLPKSWQSKTLQTLRYDLLLVPGMFVNHNGKQILRFPKNSPWQKIFFEAKNKAEKLNDLNNELKRTEYLK